MADELSIWDDDLEGVTERRAVLPGPVAVLNDFVGVESTRGRDRDRLQHGVVAIAPPQSQHVQTPKPNLELRQSQ